MFLAFPESEKIKIAKYHINSSTLKHALIDNNKESIIESRIMRLS